MLVNLQGENTSKKPRLLKPLSKLPPSSLVRPIDPLSWDAPAALEVVPAQPRIKQSLWLLGVTGDILYENLADFASQHGISFVKEMLA